MSNTNKDIQEMLDVLNLPECSKKFDQMLGEPALGSYSPIQFLREVLQPQYDVVLNKRFADNLRKSSLIETDAKVENLRTGNGRVYNETTVQQLLTFRFAEDRKNVGVFGVSGVGNRISLRLSVLKHVGGTTAASLSTIANFLRSSSLWTSPRTKASTAGGFAITRSISCCSLMTSALVALEKMG